MEFSLKRNKNHFELLYSTLKSVKGSGELVGYISTFNIDLDMDLHRLLRLFDKVYLVVNTNPLRNRINNSESKVKELLEISNVELYLNRHNHSKIIASEICVYIGSCNFSGASFYNIEAGITSQDVKFNSKVIEEFKVNILSESSNLEKVAENYKKFKIKELIDDYLPKYELLVDKISEVEDVSSSGLVADTAGLKLSKLELIISEIENVYEEASSVPCFVELNILSNLKLDKNIASLNRILHKIKQFRADANSLVYAAESLGYDTSTMLMSDYEKLFDGEVAMDRFNKNKEVFEELSVSLKFNADELKEQLDSITKYLKTLMWFGNKYNSLLNT
ncbi:hypothetical protein [Vibrio sp. Vb2658]|uniref:hypothetical protein n=1 Tax=Vibrio sp. Vb2658 TaxID=3074672 RepID=UPI002809F7A9|nr:hypothetical protein [Vibrio sp. Vb2658]ELA7834532.1 hypothetical protein [Vibrio alginolyticus]MDW1661182.1 hypothetical protein [Vibrio sp. Vb2658]